MKRWRRAALSNARPLARSLVSLLHNRADCASHSRASGHDGSAHHALDCVRDCGIAAAAVAESGRPTGSATSQDNNRVSLRVCFCGASNWDAVRIEREARSSWRARERRSLEEFLSAGRCVASATSCDVVVVAVEQLRAAAVSLVKGQSFAVRSAACSARIVSCARSLVGPPFARKPL